MGFFKTISSTQNPQVKNLVQLQDKSKARQEQGQFVLEGLRELDIALKAGYEPLQIFYCPRLLSLNRLMFELPALQEFKQLEWIEVEPAVFAKIAYREDVGNVVTLCRLKAHHLADLQLPPSPLLLVVEGVEKPGNLGALLRTADAAGLNGVIVADPRVDIYNPNVIRSSVGCVFSSPLAVCSVPEAIAFLKAKGIPIWVSDLEAAEFYHRCNLKGAGALVMGTEATGITEAWRQAADLRLKIPMKGRIDSMNVSNAAAILMYEAQRQREQL